MGNPKDTNASTKFSVIIPGEINGCLEDICQVSSRISKNNFRRSVSIDSHYFDILKTMTLILSEVFL